MLLTTLFIVPGLFLLVLVVLLVLVSPLFWCRPALVRCFSLVLRIKVVVRGEGVVQVIVIASVGAGVDLLLAGVQLQCAVPHSVTAVDQQTCGAWTGQSELKGQFKFYITQFYNI